MIEIKKGKGKNHWEIFYSGVLIGSILVQDGNLAMSLSILTKVSDVEIILTKMKELQGDSNGTG